MAKKIENTIKARSEEDSNITSSKIKENLQFDIRNLRLENYFKLLMNSQEKPGSIMIYDIMGVLPENILIKSSVRGDVNYLLNDKTSFRKIIIPFLEHEIIGVGIKEIIKDGMVDFQYEIIHFS